MTHEEKVKIFREIEMEYLIEDARNHTENAYDPSNPMSLCCECMTDEDFAALAEIFQDNHDCNIADNQQWEAIIENYINQEMIWRRPECKIARYYEQYKKDWFDENITPDVMRKARENYDNRGEDDKDLSFENYVEKYGYPSADRFARIDEFMDTYLEDYMEESEDE